MFYSKTQTRPSTSSSRSQVDSQAQPASPSHTHSLDPDLPLPSPLPIDLEPSLTSASQARPTHLPIPHQINSLISSLKSNPTLNSEPSSRFSDPVLLLLLLDYLVSSSTSPTTSTLHFIFNQIHQSEPSTLNTLSPDQSRRLRSILCPTYQLSNHHPLTSPLTHLCRSYPPFHKSQSEPLRLSSPALYDQSQAQRLWKRYQSPLPPLFRRQSTQGDGSGPTADGC